MSLSMYQASVPTITRALNVYEEVNQDVPFAGLHWFFDHCETISDRKSSTPSGVSRCSRNPLDRSVISRPSAYTQFLLRVSTP